MKSLNIRFLFLFFVFTKLVFAQFDPGAKQIALSNSDIAVSDNVFALFNNPAGIAQIDNAQVGVFYSPSPFGLGELKNAYGAFSFPMSFGAIAVGGMVYGFELYKESKISVALSYNYKNKFYVGVTTNYKNIFIKNYGSKNVIIYDLGVLAIITEDLHLGFSYRNITRTSISKSIDDLPVEILSGLSYRIINNCTISLAIEKDIRYKASPRFGIDYKIIEFLSLRSGFSKNPNLYTFGIGIHYSFFNFNYALFTHQELGLTHQIGVVITFGNSKGKKDVE